MLTRKKYHIFSPGQFGLFSKCQLSNFSHLIASQIGTVFGGDVAFDSFHMVSTALIRPKYENKIFNMKISMLSKMLSQT